MLNVEPLRTLNGKPTRESPDRVIVCLPAFAKTNFAPVAFEFWVVALVIENELP